MVKPWESLIIGAIGGLASILLAMGVDRLKIDDPVGAVAVHGAGGLWVWYTLFSKFVMKGIAQNQ